VTVIKWLHTAPVYQIHLVQIVVGASHIWTHQSSGFKTRNKHSMHSAKTWLSTAGNRVIPVKLIGNTEPERSLMHPYKPPLVLALKCLTGVELV